MKNLYRRKPQGFSIIELLVVIVVIGILAAITFVFYTGVQSRAVDASVQSDINNMNSGQLQYGLDNAGSALAYYSGSGPSSTLGFTPNGGNIIDVVTNGKDYCIRGYNTKGTKNSINNPITKESSSGVCDILPASIASSGLWIAGIAATVLAGKYVRSADLGSTISYKTTSDAVASPQGATGLDPNYPSNMSLVSPQTNPGVDFSAYPAQNACKAIGGRLPNTQELLAIYAGRASYGNNFQADLYWSSTGYSSYSAYTVNFSDGDGSTGYGNIETNDYPVRCVSG